MKIQTNHLKNNKTNKNQIKQILHPQVACQTLRTQLLALRSLYCSLRQKMGGHPASKYPLRQHDQTVSYASFGPKWFSKRLLHDSCATFLAFEPVSDTKSCFSYFQSRKEARRSLRASDSWGLGASDFQRLRTLRQKRKLQDNQNQENDDTDNVNHDTVDLVFLQRFPTSPVSHISCFTVIFFTLAQDVCARLLKVWTQDAVQSAFEPPICLKTQEAPKDLERLKMTPKGPPKTPRILQNLLKLCNSFSLSILCSKASAGSAKC